MSYEQAHTCLQISQKINEKLKSIPTYNSRIKKTNQEQAFLFLQA